MVEAGSGKQNPENVSFSLSYLAQPPACSMSGQLLFQILQGRDSTTSLAPVPEPASPCALRSSFFQKMEAGETWSRNRVTEKMGDKQNKSGQRTPNEEELRWS